MSEKQKSFFGYCPFCGRAMSFDKETARLFDECPTCGSPISFAFSEEGVNAEITPFIRGESFIENGYIVQNGTLRGYNGKEKTLVTPAGVISIGKEAFKDCAELKEIIISEGVRHIEEGAFSGCLNARKVTLPKSLKTMGHFAFKGCRRLEKIDIPQGLVGAGYSLFQYCDNLLSLEMPMDMRYLAGSPYPCCRRLKKANIPHSVTETSHWFIYNDSLEEIVLGRGVRWLSHIDMPKLGSVYFSNPEGWEVFPSVVGTSSHIPEKIPAETLRNPRKATLLLKKYSKLSKTIYIPRELFSEEYYLDLKKLSDIKSKL